MATCLEMEGVFLSDSVWSISWSLSVEAAPDDAEPTCTVASVGRLPFHRRTLMPIHTEAVNSVLIRAAHMANDCYYTLKDFPLLSCFVFLFFFSQYGSSPGLLGLVTMAKPR